MIKNLTIILYSLLVLLGFSLVLSQNSVELYWQQAYHKDSPWSHSNSHIMQWGKTEQSRWQEWEASHLQSWQDFDEKSLSAINYVWFDVSLPCPNPTVSNTTIDTGTIKNHAGTVTNETSTTSASATTNSTALPQKIQSFTLNAGDKVFFVGDSLMQGVAPHVKQKLYKQYNIESIDLSKQSTGLAYPHFFNWPKVVEDTLKKNPDIRLMVVYLGPNDPWSFPEKPSGQYLKFQSPEWETIYRARIQSIIQAAQKNKTRVLWLGAPNMKKVQLNQGMVYLNQLYQQETERSHERYLPTRDILGSKDDQFVNFVQKDGANVKVRVDDGIHFTPAGQRLIADKVMDLIHATAPVLPSDNTPKKDTHSDADKPKNPS